MKEITIGSLIEKERKLKKINRKKLCKNICSENTLYNIETGKYDANLFLLEILLQRLGRSPDKLEIILTNEEYELVECKESVMEAIYKKNWQQAKSMIERFPKKSNTDKMYISRTKSFLIYQKEKNIELAKEYIYEAIHFTLSGFNIEEIDQYLISTYEMENLLFLEQLKIEECKKNELNYSTNNLECFKDYIDKHFVDHEEHAKIYSKCCFLLSKQYQLQGEYLKIIQICQKAINELRDYTIFCFMIPLLKQLKIAQKQQGILEKNNKWYRYEKVLTSLWKDYAQDWYPMDSIFYNCYQKEYSLDSEFIKSERIAKNISQEELIEGIYQSPETLSRIENHKTSPNKIHFQQLMDKLGAERRKYYAYVVTESFEVMELRQELNILIMEGKNVEAMQCVEKLKKIIDLSEIDNQMNIEFLELCIQDNMKMISIEELVEKERELYLSMLNEEKNRFSHILTRNEVIIINNVCIHLSKIGQEKKAMELYQEVLNQMKESKIDLKFRYRSYALIQNNYNRRKSLINSSIELIKFSFLCGKGYGITQSLNSIANELENKDITECLLWAKKTYVLCDLFHFDNLKNAYRNFLIKNNEFNSKF